MAIIFDGFIRDYMNTQKNDYHKNDKHKNVLNARKLEYYKKANIRWKIRSVFDRVRKCKIIISQSKLK